MYALAVQSSSVQLQGKQTEVICSFSKRKRSQNIVAAAKNSRLSVFCVGECFDVELI